MQEYKASVIRKRWTGEIDSRSIFKELDELYSLQVRLTSPLIRIMEAEQFLFKSSIPEIEPKEDQTVPRALCPVSKTWLSFAEFQKSFNKWRKND